MKKTLAGATVAAVLLLAGCSSTPSKEEACAGVKGSVDRIDDSVQLAGVADSKSGMRVHIDSVQSDLKELAGIKPGDRQVADASGSYVERGDEWVQEARHALNGEQNSLDVAQSSWLEARADLERACSW